MRARTVHFVRTWLLIEGARAYLQRQATEKYAKTDRLQVLATQMIWFQMAPSSLPPFLVFG